VGTRALLAGALSLAAALPASAAARTITSGTITVGHGANGVELGATRAQVVHELGRPNSENQFGTMSYGSEKANTLFDIYRTSAAASGTVRQFVIASPGNQAFKLQDGNKVFTRGGLRRVYRHYGRRLKFHRFDDGTPYYEIVSRLHSRKVLNDFETDRHSLDARVLDVFIVYG
jgi:hypothetical protein